MLNELVKLSQQGDEDATLTLIKHFKPTMLKHATYLAKLNVLACTIEDYYSELLVSFLHALQLVNPDENERSIAKYLHTAILNRRKQIFVHYANNKPSLNKYMVASLDKTIPSKSGEGEPTPLVSLLSDKNVKEFPFEIEDFLSRNLSAKSFEVMRLHTLEGLSYKEIADMLNIKHSTVLARKHNAMHHMRRRANVLLK